MDIFAWVIAILIIVVCLGAFVGLCCRLIIYGAMGVYALCLLIKDTFRRS